MVQKLIDAWNGGKKAFFSALAGALLGALPVALTVGEYKGKIDTLEASYYRHVNDYTPNISGDYYLTKTRVAVLDERTCALQKSLDEIKVQNETIIRLMRRSGQQ